MTVNISELLAYLRQTSFRDVAGSHASLRIPIGRSLINASIASALRGRSTPVKSVDVQPHDGDAIDVVVEVAWPFVPTLKVAVTIQRQPIFPDSPILVLHWSLAGGLGAIASRFVKGLDRLPPGVTLQDQFIVIDIPRLAAGSPAAAAAIPHVRSLQLHSVEGRLVLEGELEIDGASHRSRGSDGLVG